MLEDIRTLTTIAGAAMVLLSMALIIIQPKGRVYRAFSLLLVLRGALYVLIGLNQNVFALPYRLGVFALIGIPFAALNFAIVYGNVGTRRKRRMARLGILAATLAFEILYVLDAPLFLGTNRTVGLSDLFIYLSYAAYAGVALLLLMQVQRTPGRMHRGGLLLMSAGFAMEPTLQATHKFWTMTQGGAVDLMLFALNLAILATLAILAALVFQLFALTRHGEAELREPARRYLLTLLAPAGCAAAVVTMWQLPPGTLGIADPFRFGLGILFASDAFWHIMLVCIAVFALVRYRIFGIEQGATRGVQAAVAAILLLGVYATALNIADLLAVGSQFEQTTAAAGAMAALALPAAVVAAKVAGRLLPGVDGSPAYREARRIQLFGHDVETILADGLLMEQERRALEDLRLSHGLDADEAQAVVEQVLEQLPPVRTSYFPLLRERDAEA